MNCVLRIVYLRPNIYTKTNMEDLDLSDYKVTSEVHVFSEGESVDDDEHIGKVQVSINNP